MPELPQLNEQVRQELLLALVPGVGPLLRHKLLTRFETAGTILTTAARDLQGVDGIGPTLARRISTASQEIDVDQQLEIAHANDIRVLLESDEDYPHAASGNS